MTDKERVYEFIQDSPHPVDSPLIAACLGMNADSVSSHLLKLFQEKKIVKLPWKNRRGRTSSLVYTTPEKMPMTEEKQEEDELHMLLLKILEALIEVRDALK